jgi:prefoldin subunit 5
MAKALEKRGTQEVVDCNLAIEALKKEVETLEAEKDQLVGEVRGLRVARTDLENLWKEVESLNKQMEGVKAAETLVGEHALKAIETAKNLHKVVDAKRESSTALKMQVDLVSNRVEDAKEVGLAVAKLYASTIEQFRGSMSLIPSKPLAFVIFS